MLSIFCHTLYRREFVNLWTSYVDKRQEVIFPWNIFIIKFIFKKNCNVYIYLHTPAWQICTWTSGAYKMIRSTRPFPGGSEILRVDASTVVPEYSLTFTASSVRILMHPWRIPGNRKLRWVHLSSLLVYGDQCCKCVMTTRQSPNVDLNYISTHSITASFDVPSHLETIFPRKGPALHTVTYGTANIYIQVDYEASEI